MPSLKKTSPNKPELNKDGKQKITSGTIAGTYSHDPGSAPGFKNANARKA